MSNIVSLVLILASVGLFFGYIDPTYADIRAKRVEKADYDSALDKSKELQAERDKLLEKFNSIDKVDREDIAKLLPDNIDNVRLIIDIDEMAKNYGMRVRNLQTTTSGKSDTIAASNASFGTLTLSFTTTAPYQTFLSFLRDLEKSLRIIDVSELEFSSDDTGGLYDYNLTIKTYWLK